MSNYTTLLNNFNQFDTDNPKIWDMLVKFSYQALGAGLEKTSISLLVERIRWEVQVVTKSNDSFKISNNHRAFYARKLMDTYPEFKGLFRIREQALPIE